jgi:hypothetical protein
MITAPTISGTANHHPCTGCHPFPSDAVESVVFGLTTVGDGMAFTKFPEPKLIADDSKARPMRRVIIILPTPRGICEPMLMLELQRVRPFRAVAAYLVGSKAHGVEAKSASAV